MGEGEVCIANSNEQVGNENSVTADSKRGHDWLAENTDPEEAPCKKQVKEASNDDGSSEVLNPTVSPRENNSSSQTSTSQVLGLTGNNGVGCGEISSGCSGNSSSGSLSVEEGARDGVSGAVSATHVVEAPLKQACSSGVKKITFRFSKSKDHQVSASPAQPTSDLVSNGLFGRSFDEEPGTSNNSLCAPVMELKMSKKIIPECCPTNVKKLLLTGILEGAKVKYIIVPGQKELCGIIRGSGFLCGCLSCNFSKVVTALEFELHAGGKTKHPSNHIFLENGRSIYNIVHELRTTPFSEIDDAIKELAGSSVNEDLFRAWRASFQLKAAMEDDMAHQVKPASLPYQFTRYPNQVVENSLTSGSRCMFLNNSLKRQIYMENMEALEHVAKKPNCSLPKSYAQQKKPGRSTKKRDNDLHRLLFLPNGLPDGAELAYYAKGQRVLGGYKRGNGIVCSHCDCEVSPSQFEAHAGWAVKRQPYRHIYTANGLTLHDIAISLASGQSLTSGDSDDMCTICGDGGDLIFCHGCPRAFHAACLELLCSPEGDWHCQHCRDFGPTGRAAGESTRPIVIRLTRVVKAPESEPGGCVVCGDHDFTPAIFHERTVIICDQCEREYHVACLREIGRCDLKELPKEEWFCTSYCSRIHLELRNIVSSGAEIIPASISSNISSKHLNCGLAVDGKDVQWQIISGKNRRPEHLSLLSKATAIFRECFDPILSIAGRDLIPVMVYGRNISGQEFGGMYCVVLIVKSVVVSACLLRIFGRDAAELPLVATSRENQGKGYFQALFSCIERLLYSLNVGTMVLPAAEDAESIWTKKFAFQKMTKDRLSKFTKEFRPTVFSRTSMLEKDVQCTGE